MIEGDKPGQLVQVTINKVNSLVLSSGIPIWYDQGEQPTI